MSRSTSLSFIIISVFLIAGLLGGCGSAKKEGGTQVTQTDLNNAAVLGDANCLQCHNAGKDLTMLGDADTRTIGAVWQDSLHNSDINGGKTASSSNASTAAHCEDCHGGGQFHWGLGPLAHPVPDYNVCNVCHGKTNFATAPHANTNNVPDKVFSQIPTSVSQGQHIEECSVCHNSNQRFVFDNAGNLLKPDPTNLPTLTVSCASCHDAHQPGKIYYKKFAQISTARYQIFRKVQVTANGANDANTGTWIRPVLFVDPATPPPGKSLNHEVLCASCHTKGTYKRSGGATHNADIYSQWKNSGHGDFGNGGHGPNSEPAWAEFTDGGGEGIVYPADLTTPDLRNHATSDRYICLQCHNGVATDIYMSARQGTAGGSDSAIIWGDSRATCITCHNVHGGGTDGLAVKSPSVMSFYSSSYVTIKGKVFLDNQPVPTVTPSNSPVGNSTVCIFCHQGRESGLTTYFKTNQWAVPSFNNSHYLPTAAILWSANGYEYPGQQYSTGNQAHQNENCVDCHMSNPTTDNQAGGHSWVPAVATCNAAACHGGPIAPPMSGDPDTPNSEAAFVDTYRATSDTNNYSGDTGGAAEPIAVAIQSLEIDLANLLFRNGYQYNDTLFPYFSFVAPTAAWTAPAAKAAFNLGFVIKALPSAPSSPTLINPSVTGGPTLLYTVPDTSSLNGPNNSAAVHNYKYTIELLIDSYTDLYNNSPAAVQAAVPAPATFFRPPGTRNATVYGTGLNQ